MPLFTFEEVEVSSQEAVKKAFRIETSKTLLLDAKRMTTLSTKDFNEPLVVLGHTQVVHKEGLLSSTTRMTIHDMDPKTMAEKFAKSIAEKDRAKVQDIYLFACEAGLKDSSDSPCFARKFAHEMHKKGFVNLQVHAITSPADRPDFVSMRLEVTHKAGKRAAVEVGHVRAFMTTQEYEDNAVRLEELQSRLDSIPRDNIKRTAERTSLHKEIQSITKRQQELGSEGLIMESDSPKAEFDRPENSFRAQAKISDILVTAKTFSLAHAQAAKTSEPRTKDRVIALIESKLAENPDTKLAENLKALQNKIKAAPENWQDVISKDMRKYEKTKNPLKNADTSTYYRFLQELITQIQLAPSVSQSVVETTESRPKKSRKHKKSDSTSSSESSERESVTPEKPQSNLQAVIDFVSKLEKDYPNQFIESGATPKHYSNWKQATTELEIYSSQAQNPKQTYLGLVENYLYAIKAACNYLAKKPNDGRQVALDKHIELGLEKLIRLEGFANIEIPNNLGIKIPVKQTNTGIGIDTEELTVPLLQEVRQSEKHDLKQTRPPEHTLGDIDKFYAFKERVHSSPARSDVYTEQGDALKQRILEKFKSQIEQTQDRTDLHNTITRIKSSPDYKILETGQDRFTRVFRLKTSSVKAFESMVDEQKKYIDDLEKNPVKPYGS